VRRIRIRDGEEGEEVEEGRRKIYSKFVVGASCSLKVSNYQLPITNPQFPIPNSQIHSLS